MIFMIKKPSEGTYLGRIIKRAQYFFDSLASYLFCGYPHFKILKADQLEPTVCPWAKATSASRNFPIICSGEKRFLIISLPPINPYSNLTYGSVFGGQVKKNPRVHEEGPLTSAIIILFFEAKLHHLRKRQGLMIVKVNRYSNLFPTPNYLLETGPKRSLL